MKNICNVNFEKLSDIYNFKLIELTFQHLNLSIDKETYEESVEEFIKENNELKSNDTKYYLKFLIELVENNFTKEDKYFVDYLNSLGI
jgi:hypothetical protein